MGAYKDDGLTFDLVLYCHHHPDGTVVEWRKECDCRKPAPGLLIRAAAELGRGDLRDAWMIGDSDVDIQAGAAVGATTVLVEEPLSAHRRTGSANPDHRVGSVLFAAELVVAGIRHPSPGET